MMTSVAADVECESIISKLLDSDGSFRYKVTVVIIINDVVNSIVK